MSDADSSTSLWYGLVAVYLCPLVSALPSVYTCQLQCHHPPHPLQPATRDTSDKFKNQFLGKHRGEENSQS